MRVKEWKDTVIFMYELALGAADRSYGIQVARLAGLPPTVLNRAQAVLAVLEQEERGSDLTQLTKDLPLFSDNRRASDVQPLDPLRKRLQEIQPDDLTPREALEVLYSLHRGLDLDE